jgi:integrase
VVRGLLSGTRDRGRCERASGTEAGGDAGAGRSGPRGILGHDLRGSEDRGNHGPDGGRSLFLARESAALRRCGWRGKGNKERLVPMGPRLRRSLRRYLRQREALVPVSGRQGEDADSPLPHLLVTEKSSRITEGTLRRRLYVWIRESRLKKADVKPHDLRRTFGTWFLQ